MTYGFNPITAKEHVFITRYVQNLHVYKNKPLPTYWNGGHETNDKLELIIHCGDASAVQKYVDVF